MKGAITIDTYPEMYVVDLAITRFLKLLLKADEYSPDKGIAIGHLSKIKKEIEGYMVELGVLIGKELQLQKQNEQ